MRGLLGILEVKPVFREVCAINLWLVEAAWEHNSGTRFNLDKPPQNQGSICINPRETRLNRGKGSKPQSVDQVYDE